MKSLVFATTNPGKFSTAQKVCAEHDITVTQKIIEIDEIQGEDPEKIACDKALRAFEVTGQPVLITDDSWEFRGLRGFPGPYMHSINNWFLPDDFIRLTKDLKDKRVTLTQSLVYDDGMTQKVFQGISDGQVIGEARGEDESVSHRVIAMDGYGGKTIAEVYNSGENGQGSVTKVWHEFAEWFAAQSS